jgi:hypothetical protein
MEKYLKKIGRQAKKRKLEDNLKKKRKRKTTSFCFEKLECLPSKKWKITSKKMKWKTT